MSNHVQIFDSEMGRELYVKELIRQLFPPIDVTCNQELLDYAANTDVQHIIDECVGNIRRNEQYIDFIRNAFIINDGLGHKNANMRKINDKYLAFLHTSQEQLVSLMFEDFYTLWTDIGINEKYRSYHKFKTLCEFYARIIVVIELDFYMRAKHEHMINADTKETVDESEEIRSYLNKGILKYIFKLYVDIESGHTTVYKYRYQDGNNYIKEPMEYTDFNTNIVLGYIGINDVDVKNETSISSIVNDTEKKKLLVDSVKSALEYQVGLTFSENRSKQYFEVTDRIAVDGRFMCPLPISRKYLDIIVNYIHEFLGIKVEKNGNDYKFVSVEVGDNTFTLNSSNASYYHYLNCIYKNPESLHKPLNSKDHSSPTTYLFKEWNCDAGCFSMIVEREKMDEFFMSMRKECRKRYKDKEIEECYDLTLKPSIKQSKLEYGTIFKAKPNLDLKLLENSKVNAIAHGFSDNSNVKILNIIRFEKAYNLKSATLVLNRINLCKFIFDTANAFDYKSSIRPFVKSPVKLFSQMMRCDFGLYVYTKPFVQYHSAITLAKLINGSTDNDEALDLDNLDTFESLLDNDKEKASNNIQEWKDKFAKLVSTFESTVEYLDAKFKDVKRLDDYGNKGSNSVNSVYLCTEDVCKALRDLIAFIKPDISSKEKELIVKACYISDVYYKTSSFKDRGGWEKYSKDSYDLNVDVIMGTIIKDKEDNLVWGDKDIHCDIQFKKYPEIINNENTTIEDVPKFFNDILLSNVECAVSKYFKIDEEVGEEETLEDYEIPNCDWLFKIYKLSKADYANGDIQQYIRTSAKNMLIRLRRILNK